MPPYPRWRYFPAYAAPPDWVEPLVSIFTASREMIDSAVTHDERMESNDVLRVLASGLIGMGFEVEQGKTKIDKLPRPVFFGDEGTFLRTYEIDTFEPDRGIALEEVVRGLLSEPSRTNVLAASATRRSPER